MSLLAALFGRRDRPRVLAEPIRAGIARWHAIEAPQLQGPLATQRWLVVDVETTGLDMRHDRLLAIGAVLVEGTTLQIDKSFEVVVKQATASASDNILIHRIGGREQVEGVDAAAALVAFLTFSQKLPCVAFHAQFDETMLKRAFDEYLGIDFSTPFIDLALLAPALIGEAAAGRKSLDDWVDYFGIAISARHRAVADAVGTAQLLQILLSRAMAQKIPSAATLFKIAREQRWLAKINRK